MQILICSCVYRSRLYFSWYFIHPFGNEEQILCQRRSKLFIISLDSDRQVGKWARMGGDGRKIRGVMKGLCNFVFLEIFRLEV